MAWQRIPGLEGRVFVPEHRAEGRKNQCRDCYACQGCGDERCAVCIPATNPTVAKLPNSSRASAREVCYEENRLSR